MVVFLFHTIIYVFLLLCLMYSYCTFMKLHHATWHSSVTLTEVLPCFFLSCKADARVNPRKDGARPPLFQTFCVVLRIVCFVSFCALFVCVCVNVYCTTATGWLPNCSQQIYTILNPGTRNALSWLWAFHCFLHYLPENAAILSPIRQQSIPTLQFPIYYSLITLSFNSFCNRNIHCFTKYAKYAINEIN